MDYINNIHLKNINARKNSGVADSFITIYKRLFIFFQIRITV